MAQWFAIVIVVNTFHKISYRGGVPTLCNRYVFPLSLNLGR
jgi:hypothetical protein